MQTWIKIASTANGDGSDKLQPFFTVKEKMVCKKRQEFGGDSLHRHKVNAWMTGQFFQRLLLNVDKAMYFICKIVSRDRPSTIANI